ncbi:hypothetical protein JAAARDRAFT_63657 [Jaapia argillacea MUCL 33604]|uniref:Protein kinase domain-containing protein n=1 Tax=Jaapia argillacea MUCL 33604 TaxID=933084 RepID=A0A067PEV1_9AGAM|nr:hypothetical protein JAAARDRAFT_63657 [Jaapia argillacea MUCL 33604]
MVPPWMQNGTVLEFLEKEPNANRYRLVVDVARGLNYMHSVSIIHGDPKPHNILVDNTGRACLCDFGCSDVMDEGSSGGLAIQPHRGATTRYTAPELHLGFEDGEDGESGSYKSLASDIFSLASVILEVFTGLPPFCEFRKDAWVVLAIMSGAKPSRPRNTKQQFSDRLWDLMEQCWTFDPRGRPLIKDVLELLTTISLAENVEPGTSTKVGVSPSVEATWVGVEKLYKTTRATIGKTLFGTESFSSLRKLCRALGRHPQMCTISGGLRVTSNKPIGAGTFSNVYRGCFGQHDAAIKIIREFRSNGDDRNIKEKRFSTEAIVWHFLKHENLVPFLGVSSTIPLFPKASEAPLCLVSEWMPHGTVSEYIVNHPSVSRLKLLSEIANGLDYLHSYSLVHGDLKGVRKYLHQQGALCVHRGLRADTVHLRPNAF